MPLTLLERFIGSYDTAIQDRMQALVNAIGTAHSFTDLEEFLTLSQSDVANDIAGLSSSNGFISGFSQDLINKTDNLLSICSPKDNVEDRFYAMFGPNLRAGLIDFVETLIEKAVINDYKDIANASSATIATQLAGQTCNTPIVQGFASNLLSDMGLFLNNVTRKVSFTAAVHPENNNAVPLYIKCFDEDNSSALIGELTTTSNGVFELSYAETIPEDGSVIVKDLKFEVYVDAEASTPFDTVYKTFDPATETTFTINIDNPPAQADTSSDISDLSTVGVSFPSGFLTYLSGKGVTTLQDVRNKGGIYHFDDLPSGSEAVVAAIDNYASLSLLTNDLTVCRTMYDAGYQNIPLIANTPRPKFISSVNDALSNPIDTIPANRLYVAAQGVFSTQNTIIQSAAAAKKNGFENIWLQDVSGAKTIKSLLGTECNCDDCESGVSPLAYLSALIKYITDNVTDSGTPINISFLENNFYQPFGQLSTDCEEVDKKVCQIRVCIDVLRRYYLVNDSSISTTAKNLLRKATKEYLLDTYNTILNRIGTSYEELTETPETNKDALAKRLGIDKSKLNSLKLDIRNASITDDIALINYENDLERIFGFPSTVRNPLSQGYSNVDPLKVRKWDITGQKWGYNTDSEGYIYIEELFEVPTSNKCTLYLHKSNTFTDNTRVAVAVVNQSEAPTFEIANFTPLNNSGVFGNFQVAMSDSISGSKFSLFPEYVSWKLQKINEEWKSDDTQINNIFTNTDENNDTPSKKHKYPYVDPDLINLDDIRAPYTTGTPDSASELWIKRRDWLDNLFNAIYQNTSPTAKALFIDSDLIGPQSPRVFEHLKEIDITYESTTIKVWGTIINAAQLYGWSLILADSTSSSYSSTVDLVWSKAKLKPEELIRYFELINGFTTIGKEVDQTPTQRENTHEFVNLAILAIKRTFFQAWIAEEQNCGVWLNQLSFYKSLSQPKTGAWPLIIQPYKTGVAAVPLIEPGYVSLADMVDNKMLYHDYDSSGTIKTVFKIYDDRKTDLLNDIANIKTYREAQDNSYSSDTPAFGFEQLILSVNTGTGTFLFDYEPDYTGNNTGAFKVRFFKLYEDIKANVTLAVSSMQNESTGLAMTIPEFYDLFDYYQTCLEQGLTDAQWQAVYELMQKGLKRRFYYSTWNTEEASWVTSPSTVALKYWQVQKQKLVKWRATEENRRLWEEFLDRSTQPPTIDPDYIYYSNFIDPRDSDGAPSPTAYSNPPYTLWETRQGVIATWRSALTNNIDTYITYVGDVYEGYSIIDLYDDYLTNGTDISKYLVQLNLTFSTLETLYKLKKKYPSGSITETPDQEIAKDIMLNIRKQRNSSLDNWGGWLRSEAIDGFYISPQVFALPADTSLSFNLAIQVDNTWLVNTQIKKAWQQTLKSRVDFQNALIKNHADLIESIEDDNLIQLRDALVVSISKPQFDQAVNAQWITDNLLIDAKTNCCSATTRVAQSIETLQVFLFSLRNGILEDNYPDLEIMNDYFDDHWKWLGSYEAWRALMFTYLYPENLLDPAYRQYQTGKFREITDAIVSNSRFNPAIADDAAKQYQEYFEDITTLVPSASVVAKVVDKGAKIRTFVFARGGKTGNLYYTTYDLADRSGQATNVATWEPVPGMKDTTRVAGATIFQVTSGEPYIYVMANLRTDKTTVVRFNRFSLSKLGWDSESTEIEVDKKFDATTAILESTFDPLQTPYVGMKMTKDEIDTKRLFVFQFNKEGKAFTDKIRAIGAWIGKLYSLIRVQTDTGIEYTYCVADFKDEKRTDVNFQLTTGMFKSSPEHQEEYEYWYAEKQFKPKYNLVDGDKDRFIGVIYQREKNRVHIYLNSRQGPSYQPVNLFTTNSPTNNILEQKIDVRDKELKYIGPVNPIQLSEAATVSETFIAISYGGTGGRLIRNGRLTLSLASTPASNIDEFWNEIIKPVVDITISLDRKDNSDELQRRRFNTYKNLSINKDAHQSQWVYLQEYYYFMPMLLAIQLQKNKFYTEALDWYRQVFDYSAPLGKRKIYFGLTMEENIQTGNVLNGNIYGWLAGPTDPHQIASMRPNNYTRFTVYSVSQCLLDFADSEYTRDTTESVPRARTLYSFALELLQSEVFSQQDVSADELINGLDWLITDATVWDTWVRIKNLLRKVDDYDTLFDLVNATDGTITVVINNISIPLWEDKIERIIYLIQDALTINKPKVAITTQVSNTNDELFKMHLAASATPGMSELLKLAQRLSIGDSNNTISALNGQTLGAASDNNSNPSYLKDKYEVNFSFDQLDFSPGVTFDFYASEYDLWQKSAAAGTLQNQKIKPAYLPLFTNYYCVVPNPIPDYMRMHAEIQLLKIRNCMNISGLKRELDPYAAPIDATSGIPSMIGGGRLNVSSTIPRSATIYRYQFLVERAKQLVSYAQQLEGSLLNALEKRDAEYYTLMKARQDLNISRASVTLNDLRLKEAENGVVLAQYQQDRSQLQVDGLQSMIDAGLNRYEESSINIYRALLLLKTLVIQKDYLLTSAKAATSASYTGVASLATTIGFAYVKAIYESQVTELETTLSTNSIFASQARREQEWNFQKALAIQDIKIGGQQIKLAEDRVRIVGQEKRIAEMQSSYAEDTVNFLSSKFTNVQLYEWMVRILQRTYDFMLQQATSVAKTAQLQLAFERQESPTGIIQDDYWVAPADSSGNSDSADRRGLTGSTRLLADIVKLESYAIDTNRRKLQLTKTISLATYFPLEFQQFRETGQFNFQTTLQHFDRDFAGHYLRLIRSVRTSVIALTPPNEGIKATLANTGTSTVIIKANNAFIPVRSRKDPDSVALTSPYNASGMFELQQQDPNIYLPFEGTGVETSWYFEMLKANNPFDFSTIADVLLSIEYTALEDYNYKVQKWKEANLNQNNADGSRLFSMRNDFADQWYDLSNGLLSVSFDISKFNFPANTTIDSGGNAKVYVSFGEYVEDKKATEKPKQGQTVQKLNKVSLNLEDKGVLTEQNIEYVSGQLSQISGPYSELPYGTWKFATQDADLAAKIKFGVIQDIIIIIDYKAKTVNYPVK